MVNLLDQLSVFKLRISKGGELVQEGSDKISASGTGLIEKDPGKNSASSAAFLEDASARDAVKGSEFVGQGSNKISTRRTESVEQGPGKVSVSGGEFVEEGSGKNSLRSPVLCLAELSAAITRRFPSYPLSAGEIVSTGTLTAGHPTSSGDIWIAEVEGIPLPPLTLRLI